jgi:hypothetical protein
MIGRVSLTRRHAPKSVRWWFWFLAIALGLLQVWAHRNHVGPDGTSYIEMARGVQHGDPQALVNGYWSPLYPLLLSIAFRISNTTLYGESVVVHFVNLAIYLSALYCFELFLGELLAAGTTSGQAPSELPENDRTLWIWGYLLFLWASWFWISPAEVTPDLAVACTVFLATAALLRIRQGRANWGAFAGLGVILGAGYLAKAAIFPLAFVFLLSAYALARSGKQAELRVLLAAATFAIVAGPFLLTLSESKGRVTFGDTGKLNYAWYVDGVRKSRHWQGEQRGNGVPVHPTRRISGDLPLYEFAEPVKGSYPPWYDPSYWYEGLSPRFEAKGQLMAIYRSANSYLRIWSKEGTLYLVALALLLLRRSSSRGKASKNSFLPVWAPTYAAVLMYLLVHVEARFVGGFGLVLLAAAFTSAAPMRTTASGWAKLARVLMIVAPVLAIAWGAMADIRLLLSRQSFEQWHVAQALHSAGFPAGTKVGVIGMGLDAYWAHLAEVRIIAEIPEPDEESFLNMDSARRQAILQKFADFGSSALLTDKAAVAKSGSGWRQLGNTRLYIHELRVRP